MSGVNDFVVKFATVNGSGSASANGIFAKSLFRMGIPVAPKNIFPSNIQGLPTWYEVRVSEKGGLARRDGVDLMVAMNPQSYQDDLAEVVCGGWLVYDSTLPRQWGREDIEVLALPMAQMCAKHWTDPRQRQLFKNMIYVGALTALLDMDMDVLKGVVADQLPGKEKLIGANLMAVQLGRDYALEHFNCPLPIRVRHAGGTQGKIMVSGNEAAGLGSIYAGATVCAWYPITPSTSLAEAFEKHARRLRVDQHGKHLYACMQAEDEIAAIGIAIGGGWNGARSFTATSGPGISLMSEFLGLAYLGEVPVVVFNIQRGGPSTGMPTRTQQSDVLACAYASHGDTKHVLLFPEDPYECFEFAAQCLDLADRLQTPVFMLTDLDIGMNQRLCKPFSWSDDRRYDRGKVLSREELEEGKEFARYKDLDGDGIPYRTLPGTHETKGAYFTRGTSRNPQAGYSEAGPDYVYNMQRLQKKFEFAKTLVPKPVLTPAKVPARFGCIYYGSTSPAMHEALESLAQQDIHVNALRVRGFPFGDELFDFVASHSKVFVVEQNRDAQLKHLLVNDAGINPASLISVLHYDGTPITARFITKEIAEIVAALNVRPIKKDKAA